MKSDKEINEIESSIRNIKNEVFRREIELSQEKAAVQLKENNQLQNENDKLEKVYIQLTNTKYKAIEELISQKSQIGVLNEQIEIKQKYLSSLIKTETENYHQKKNQTEKIIKLLNQISIKENSINQIIKKVSIEKEMVALLQHPKEAEYYLREMFF